MAAEEGTGSSEPSYRVVRNHEEQYSIWPADRELPPGWSATGFAGSRDDCLAHIDQAWTDMRPLSLRHEHT
jgi:MbtH protein